MWSFVDRVLTIATAKHTKLASIKAAASGKAGKHILAFAMQVTHLSKCIPRYMSPSSPYLRLTVPFAESPLYTNGRFAMRGRRNVQQTMLPHVRKIM